MDEIFPAISKSSAMSEWLVSATPGSGIRAMASDFHDPHKIVGFSVRQQNLGVFLPWKMIQG
jgi:hypothetical protein